MIPQLESVTIGGTAQVGGTLTASVEPAGATATYQWKSATEQEGSYTDIDSATSSSYLLTESESGKFIKVQATGTGEYAGEVTSAATGAVAPDAEQTSAQAAAQTAARVATKKKRGGNA